MKKRLLCLFAAVLLLCGCNGKQEPPPSTAENPVDDRAAAEIRTAISLLLDRNYIAQGIAQSGQIPASTFVPREMTDHDGSMFADNAGSSRDYSGYFDVSAEAYGENFSRAISTLQKYYAYDETTGKFRNFPTLTYLYNNSDSHRAVGEYLQNVLGSIGISVQLENQEWNTFLNTRKQGNFSLARNGWVADYNDPICFLDMWTTQSGNNDIQFGKGAHRDKAIYSLDLTPFGIDLQVQKGTWAQTYDVLIDRIKNETDETVRYQLMHLAEDMLMESGCIVPLYYYSDLYMLSPAVAGFYSNRLGYKFFQNTTVNGSGEGISVCLASEPDSIDPALNSTVDGATLISHFFAGLAKWSPAGEIVAECAQALPEGEVQPDGTVRYTYTLKENLKWSDGKPLVAGDFVYAWNRAASGHGDYGYLFQVIARDETGKLAVSAPDDRTLTVTLHNPVGYWNELLTQSAFMPVRQDAAQGNEGWATSPESYVTNGAYRMTQWEHNSVITAEKNPYYQGADGVTMKKIRFYLSDDTNNMLSNYKNGTWQMIDNVPTNEIASLKKQYPEELIITGQIGTYYICWNINADLSPRPDKSE